MHGVAYLLNTTDTAIAVLVVEIDPKDRLEEARVEHVERNELDMNAHREYTPCCVSL